MLQSEEFTADIYLHSW